LTRAPVTRAPLTRPTSSSNVVRRPVVSTFRRPGGAPPAPNVVTRAPATRAPATRAQAPPAPGPTLSLFDRIKAQARKKAESSEASAGFSSPQVHHGTTRLAHHFTRCLHGAALLPGLWHHPHHLCAPLGLPVPEANLVCLMKSSWKCLASPGERCRRSLQCPAGPGPGRGPASHSPMESFRLSACSNCYDRNHKLLSK